MKRFCILALTVIMGGVFTAGAYAQSDTVIIDEGDDSVVEGTITDIQFDYVYIDVAGEEIEVDIDGLEIENNIEDYFPIGTHVQVIGDIDEYGEMDAEKMIKVEKPATEATPNVHVITE